MTVLPKFFLATVFFCMMTWSNVLAQPAQDTNDALRQEMLAAHKEYQALSGAGDHEQAAVSAAVALEKSIELHGKPHRETAALYFNHGVASVGANLREQGMESMLAADAMYVELGEGQGAARIPVLLSLGDMERDNKKARKSYDTALRVSAEALGTKSIDHAGNLHAVGMSILVTDDWKRARLYLVNADRTYQELLPVSDIRSISAAQATALWKIKARQDASDALRRVVAGYEERDQTRHLDYRKALEFLIANTEKFGDTDTLVGLQAKLSDFYKAGPIDDDEYLPIFRVAPVYPRKALNRGIEGHVNLSFTVLPDGSTTDIEPIGGENVTMFVREAIQAVSRFKYRPRVIDGQPVAVENVKTRIAFSLSKRRE